MICPSESRIQIHLHTAKVKVNDDVFHEILVKTHFSFFLLFTATIAEGGMKKKKETVIINLLYEIWKIILQKKFDDASLQLIATSLAQIIWR